MKYSLRDNQGNPIDKEGRLVAEEVFTIEEITDADFEPLSKSVQLPLLPNNVDEAIGANGKPVVIKKNVFEKNAIIHKFSNEQSRNILKGIYAIPIWLDRLNLSRDQIYRVVIQPGDKNSVVVLDVYDKKR